MKKDFKIYIDIMWLEYIINLYHQGYYSMIWDEVKETQINLESLAYQNLINTFTKPKGFGRQR